MRKQILALLTGAMLMMGTSTAMALTIDYSYSKFPTIPSWGTMNISVVDADTLSILYSAASTLPKNTQATGFGFSFDGKIANPTVSNPDSTVVNNDTNLNWVLYSKASGTMPQITNRNDFSPVIPVNTYFEMAATEGKANNFNPPGIRAGNMDVFYLDFAGTDFLASAFNLASFVDLTGVRLQGFNEDGVKSLFLAGKEEGTNPPVPEPGTMVLLGIGMLGLVIFGKRKMSKES